MKIFYKTFQPLLATDKDKHVTLDGTDSATLEDLIKAILFKEERTEQETAFLYLPSGIPLNYTPLSVTFSLKRWYIKDGDHLFVMFTDKQNTVECDPGAEALSHKFYAEEGNACITVNVRGDRQCTLKVSENAKMQHIYERVSHSTGIPCKYIQLYHTTRFIDPGSNLLLSTLSPGESIHLKLKFCPQRRFYDAFNAKSTKILCEQTDAGLRMFYSLLFILAHYLTDEGRDLEVLSYILQLTACPPLVLSLAMIFDKRMMTIAQAVAIREGLFELFKRLTYNQRKGVDSETDANLDRTFEYSDYCWHVLLSNCHNLDPSRKLPSMFHHIICLQCHECDQHLSFCMPSRMSPGGHTLCYICGSSNLEVDQLTSQLAMALPLEEEASYWCMENWYSRESIDIPSRIVCEPPHFMMTCTVYDLKNTPAEFPPPRLFYNAEDQIIIFTGRTGKSGAVNTHYLFDPLNGEEVLEDIGKIDFCQHVKKLKGAMHNKVFIKHAPDEAVVILLDISSSMKRKAKTVLWYGEETALATTKLHIAQKFFVAFAKRTIAFGLKHALALTFFNNTIEKKCMFSESVEALVHVLEQELESIKASGDTRLWDAIFSAGEQLCKLPDICNKSTRRILCLTDGSDSGSSHSALDCAKLLCESRIILDMILIGRENTEASSLAYITGGFPFHFKEVSEALCIAEAEPLLSVRTRQIVSRSKPSNLAKGALNEYRKWPYAQLVVKNPPPSQVKLVLSQAIVEGCEKTSIPDIFRYLMIKNPITFKDLQVLTPITAVNLSKSLEKDSRDSRSKRILRELTRIAKHGIPLPSGGNIEIYALRDCVDIWIGKMPSPDNSPYVSTFLIFTVVFPTDYPKNPPQFRFETPILHPNVSSDGRVCHYLLQKRLYSQELSMTDIIRQVFVLLALPIWKDGADTIRTDAYEKNSEAFEDEARKRSESISHNELYTEPECDSDCDVPEEDEAWFLQNR